MKYTLPFSVTTSGVANTAKTLAALRSANTTGHRCRITRVTAGFGSNPPVDQGVHLELIRRPSRSSGSDGTPGDTISAANVPKKDSGSLECLITCDRNFSAEPNTLDTEPMWEADINDRNAIINPWDVDDEKPRIVQNQMLLLRAWPKTASAALVVGAIEFEMY